MDANAKNELDAIKAELSSIIKELKDISGGVRKDFKGIGNEQCANCIDRVVDNLTEAQKKLKNIDTSRVRETNTQCKDRVFG